MKEIAEHWRNAAQDDLLVMTQDHRISLPLLSIIGSCPIIRKAWVLHSEFVYLNFPEDYGR